MANSKITFTFLRPSVADDFISFKMRKIDTQVVTSLSPYLMTWKNPNPRIATKTIPTELLIGDNEAYGIYVNSDYFQNKLIVTYPTTDSVTLEYRSDLYEFFDVTSSSGFITSTINNNATTPFDISTVVASTSATPCDSGKATFTLSDLATKITINGVVLTSSNTNNPVDIDVIRGVETTIVFENAAGITTKYPQQTQQYLMFPTLSALMIELDFTYSITGTTIKADINNYSPYFFNIGKPVFEYSLDDINWQTGDAFTGQVNGPGTIYVRDQFGCKKSLDYTVSESATRTPFLFVSKANSINFSEQVLWDNQTIYKNAENTLSHERLVPTRYCLPLLFQTQDITTIQFKSNYETPTATLRKEGGADTILTINKRTSNLSRYQKMDCKYYKYKEGYTGIYFDTGNIYDEASLVIDTYVLNGNLPEMAIVGQYVDIDGIGTHQIVDKIFDDSIEKRVMIIKYTYEGTPVVSTAMSIFDLLNFEVYEFDIDWSAHGEGTYDVVLDNSNGTIIQGSPTNLFLWSELFNSGATSINGGIVTDNITTSPISDQTACSFIEQSNPGIFNKTFNDKFN
jgi:hypothetical protein